MKKINGLLLAGASIVVLASCGGKKKESITNISVPNVTLIDNVVSWDAVEHASGYIVKVNDIDQPIQTETTYTLGKVGTYTVSVKAVTEDATKWYSSSFSTTLEYSYSLSKSTLWIVGDSTACNYYDAENDKMVDDKYYYPRYGYGMEFNEYFSDDLEIKNLAISGRSSKSFLNEANYETLKTGMKKGDYLLIAFGHNDEKTGATFTDASKPLTDSTSFKYSLNKNYVMLAKSKEVSPILATPIVRLDSSNQYTGDKVHDTSTGDYAQAVRELGEEVDVPVVDLTTITKNIYMNLGYDEAKYFHSMSTIFTDDAQTIIGPNTKAPDGTHLNVYGAKRVAYEFAQAINSTRSGLRYYVDEDKQMPTKEADLVKWKNASRTPYYSPDLDNYQPKTMYTTISNGWYGTAMGNCGGDPNSYDDKYTQAVRNGFYAQETSAGVFKVGQYVLKEDGDKNPVTDGTGNVKGKCESKGDGFAFAFMRIPTNKAFTLTVDVEILENGSNANTNNKQATFGLMLRDDCLINLDTNSGKEYVTSNFVAAGFIINDRNSDETFNSTSTVNLKREGGTLSKGTNNTVATPNVGDTARITLQKENQTCICTVEYKGETYVDRYIDVKFDEMDENYMYLGMYGNRCVLCQFTNVTFIDQGEAQEA